MLKILVLIYESCFDLIIDVIFIKIVVSIYIKIVWTCIINDSANLTIFLIIIKIISSRMMVID